MSGPRTRASEVEVAADPLTAFTAFTDELDLWWVRGPINAYDSGRLVEMRCEPGVGGRILEVYDAPSGEALELARITVWEPGSRVAWKSSLDDVTIDVRFDPTSTGTRVRLEATVSEGGEDRGGSSFVRVTPAWFASWMGRRDTAPREPRELGRLALTLYYARPAAAARWLTEAFGFESPNGEGTLVDDEHESPWIELRAGNASLILERLAGPPVDHTELTYVPWVFVDGLEAHLAHAREHGVPIVQELQSHGFTSYEALDLEGRRWRFAQARPTQPR
jgi:glyoxalase/bleomycin resistance protein/dioxygenase superfamily protein